VCCDTQPRKTLQKKHIIRLDRPQIGHLRNIYLDM
jgi:hypothetical protein